MTSLIRSLFASAPRAQGSYTLDDYVEMIRNAGLSVSFTMRPEREEVGGDFVGLVQGAYRANGVVFACILSRMFLFSQARFQWQQLRGGQPGDLFGNAELGILEEPEPTKTTDDLLGRALVDADLAGNWFAVRRPDRIKRLRPDWCYLVLGSRNREQAMDPNDVDAEVVGLVYQPGGPYSDVPPQTFLVGTFAHFAPVPDPLAQYRGMSWLTPVVRNIRAHSQATVHKGKYFELGATPNLKVKFPEGVDKARAQEWIDMIEQEHAGSLNAYRTLYLGQGADAEAVGANLDQLDFKAVQGADETVIAAAARVHPVIVGLSEGMQGSSLNAGNYSTIKRQFGDGTVRPLWSSMAGAIQPIMRRPSGARLWYDDRHVPFLAEDLKDAAEVFNKDASSIRALTDGGYIPSAVVQATVARDVRLLEHAGYLPVQVQPIQGGPEEPAARVVAYERVAEPLRRPILPVALGGQYTARQTFWPVSGLASGLHVEQGTVLPANHYLVSAFPSMFEHSGVTVIDGTAVQVGGEVRCSNPTCKRLLAEMATPPYRFTCPRCKSAVAA